jgi:hypothetical protein
VKSTGWSRTTGWAARAALLALAAVLALLAQSVARADEPKLAPDEAIVLCTGTGAMLRDLEYWRVGTRRGFSVSMRGVLTPRVVKAGRYYLHSYSTLYRNVFPPTFPEPVDVAAAVDVRPGAVTYFGDVTVSQVKTVRGPKWNFAVTANPATLIKAQKSFPWLQKYPLYVSKKGGEVVPVRWSTHPEPPKPVSGEQRYGSERPLRTGPLTTSPTRIPGSRSRTRPASSSELVASALRGARRQSHLALAGTCAAAAKCASRLETGMRLCPAEIERF